VDVKKTEEHPTLVTALKALVEPVTRGDPMRLVLWVPRSLEHLTEALKQTGYDVSTYVIAGILKAHRYSLQANRKTHEGGKHPDRNAQFLYIQAQKEAFAAAGHPMLSIDGKKK
jgi:Rhodopirellula transposase DDE domain